MIKAGLLQLGLITDTRGEQYRIWYTHGASHYIGIDVHDVGEPDQRPRARHGVHDRAGDLHSARARSTRCRGRPRTWRSSRRSSRRSASTLDIGVRIEDSFLLEESGLRNLSAALPKTIDEIEALMRPAAASTEAR